MHFLRNSSNLSQIFRAKFLLTYHMFNEYKEDFFGEKNVRFSKGFPKNINFKLSKKVSLVKHSLKQHFMTKNFM